MDTTSKTIVTNQTGPHERLVELVKKHLEHDFQKPIADHSQHAFDTAGDFLIKMGNCPIVFDGCCGVGDSTRHLAKANPSTVVIGVDKSIKRLRTERVGDDPPNMLLLRADLNDFYRLMAGAGWRLMVHKIYYPNPWPKSEHLMRRWHGGPIFPYMLRLGGAIEVRSNWKLYLEEFKQALMVAGYDASLSPLEPDIPVTNHEAKYMESGHDLWRLMADISQAAEKPLIS